jgi:probable phosphoglycerate mutase
MNDNLFATSSSAEGDWLIAHCDGGSRGNPGPSGYGAVVEDAQGKTLAELSEFLGIQTNNFAEYSGLLGVLRWAIEHNVKRLRVVSDSELMVKQMQGKYKVASPILRPLFEDARKMSRRIENFEMRHTLRGGNKVADRLANEAMDRGMGKVAVPQVGKPADFQPGRSAGPIASGAGGVRPVGGTSTGNSLGTRPASAPVVRSTPPPAAKPGREVLEGYVKNGVVHLLGGELPEGIFVKIVRD